jgi:hypothetical protein
MDDSTFKLWNPSQMIATYPDRAVPSLDNIDQQNQDECLIYEEEL